MVLLLSDDEANCHRAMVRGIISPDQPEVRKLV